MIDSTWLGPTMLALAYPLLIWHVKAIIKDAIVQAIRETRGDEKRGA